MSDFCSQVSVEQRGSEGLVLITGNHWTFLYGDHHSDQQSANSVTRVFRKCFIIHVFQSCVLEITSVAEPVQFILKS